MNVGIVGIGFMGWIHWLAYQRVSEAKVTAICSRDEQKRKGDWRGIQGNFGPPGEVVNLSGVNAYAELDELLADDDVHLVDICLPPHLHVEAVSKALAAGKHVLCEKPLALTASDCDKLVSAANETCKLLLIGQVLPMFPEYAYALRNIQSGAYGKLLGGNFKRVISDPTWIKDFYDPERVGGPLIDLHVHDAHYIRLLFGMPTGVSSQGRLRGDVVEYCHSLFRFEDPSLVVGAVSGVIDQQGRGFTHGFEIHLEKATLMYEFAVIGDEPVLMMPLTVLHADGTIERPELGDGDPVNAFVAEVREAAKAVASGEPSKILSGELARDAIVICQMQQDAVKQGG